MRSSTGQVYLFWAKQMQPVPWGDSMKTDSTIAHPPPKTSDYLSRNVSWLLSTRRRMLWKKLPSRFFSRYRTMTSGWQGAPCVRRYGRELVSKPAISLRKSWGGYRRTTLNKKLNDVFATTTTRVSSKINVRVGAGLL